MVPDGQKWRNCCLWLLLALFGSSSWMCINGLWMELSVYALELPEGWNLPNWLSTFIDAKQLANIGPFLFAFLSAKVPAVKALPRAPFILIILGTSSLAMALLAFCWHRTVWLLGSARSLPLIGLCFVMALGSALSNVVFLPYLAQFPSRCLTIYFVGLSFSSSVPSLLKLAQGVGDFECVTNGTSSSQVEPRFLAARFSVKTYNLALFGWMCMATLAFALLHFHFRNSVEELSILNPGDVQRCANGKAKVNSGRRRRSVLLLASIGAVSAQMNCVIPSVLSFATLPYSLLTYHLALTLSNIAHTVANMFALWAQPRRLALLLSLVASATMCTGVLFLLALQSPEPALRHSNPHLGTAFVVCLSILAGFLCSYLRTHLTSLHRQECSAEGDGEHSLFLSGLCMQIGSVLGALCMFVLVNVLHIFRARPPCT